MLEGVGPGPSVPLVGPVKALLVDHRTLGALAGQARERLVNRFLARRLSAMMASSHTLVKVNEGETLITSNLPPVSLGTPVPVGLFVDLEVLYTKFGGGKVSRSRDKVTSGFGGHFEF